MLRRMLWVCLCTAAAVPFFIEAIGCSFDPSGTVSVGDVDEDMDTENAYLCECSCGAPSPVVTARLGGAFDDAEQTTISLVTIPDFAPLYMVRDPSLNQPFLVGLRFPTLDVPQGAMIQSAHIQFTAAQSSNVATSLEFRAESTDDAPPILRQSANLSNRTPTGASVPWNMVPAWTAGDAGPDQRSPDLAAVVQEIVDLPGWAAGNALIFLISGNATGSRVAVEFDQDPNRAAVLTVTYASAGSIDELLLPVCVPEDLNPNVDSDAPDPVQQADIEADCMNRVQATVEGLAQACGYVADMCECNAVPLTELGTEFDDEFVTFVDQCNDACMEEELAADCSNFDPEADATTATNAPGDEPVCLWPPEAASEPPIAPLAAGVFGRRSLCEVSGDAMLILGDEEKNPSASGIVQIDGGPCPGTSCDVSVSYLIGLDRISFDVRFASDPVFRDMEVTGASVQTLLSSGGAGSFGAQQTFSSSRGRRQGSDDVRALTAENEDVLQLGVNWDAGAPSCSLAGTLVGTVDSEVSDDEALAADLAVAGAIVNQPPTVSAGPDTTVECTGPSGALFSLAGQVDDPDGNVVSVAWRAGSRVGPPVGSGPSTVQVLGLGALQTYFLRAIDAFAQADEDAAQVMVVDTTAPVIESLSASPSSLWPPNHKLVGVTLAVATSDVCDDGEHACRIVSVASDEPVDGTGDGSTSPDWNVTGDLSVQLRAERSGGGDGRTYTLEVECTDASGNASTATTEVSVAHDRGMGG